MTMLPLKYCFHDSFKDIESIPCHLIYGSEDNIQSPFFSVVIPTYGRPEYLKQTINSFLVQEGFQLPFEIVVVDNEVTSTTNETERMLRKLDIPNLLYYRNSKNIGGAGNWNRGITLSRSQWIIMCHDDDLVKPTCLKIMYQIVKKHENDNLPLGYVRANAESIFEENVQHIVKTNNHYRVHKAEDAVISFDYMDVLLMGGATWAGAPTCGTLINKQAIMAVGGYNPNLAPCFDCYVPFFMIGKYGVYKTYYTQGIYRWGQNDTYNKSTLINLIKAYEEFLTILASNHIFVKIFRNEHYADCVSYYSKKAREGGLVLTHQDIDSIRKNKYSFFRLRLLYFLRKAFSAWRQLIAR